MLFFCRVYERKDLCGIRDYTKRKKENFRYKPVNNIEGMKVSKSTGHFCRIEPCSGFGEKSFTL